MALRPGEVRIQDQFEHAHHAVHRGADLVAHVGEELALSEPFAASAAAVRSSTRFSSRFSLSLRASSVWLSLARAAARSDRPWS